MSTRTLPDFNLAEGTVERGPIDYDLLETQHGIALLAAREGTLVGLTYCSDDERGLGAENIGLADLQRRWGGLSRTRSNSQLDGLTSLVSSALQGESTTPIPIAFWGTDFQKAVWRELTKIGTGCVSSYGRIAKAIGKPSASRAVGQAVGANPFSIIVPCHRVIRESGEIGNYYWGVEMKLALLETELGLSLRDRQSDSQCELQFAFA